MATTTTSATTMRANLSRFVNSTVTDLTTAMLPTHNDLVANTTVSNTTTAPAILPPASSPLMTPTPAATTKLLATKSSAIFSTVTKLTNEVPAPEVSFSGFVFLSIVLFIVAIAVVGKIIYSNRRRRSDLIGGSARWRLSASHQSGTGPQQTAASYAPMGGGRQTSERNGLDTPGPDRLDWERQFFDDTEATVPSRLQLDLSRT